MKKHIVNVLTGLVFVPFFCFSVNAADHAEAPKVTADPPGDIADVYLFRNEAGDRIYSVFTFGGIAANNPALNPTGEGMYDPDVLYTFSIDNNPNEDGDNVRSEHTIYARFGFDTEGNAGIKVENLPGAAAPVVGPVETVITSPEGLRVYAGLRDDPFFFDSIGFGQTLASFDDDPDNGSGRFMFDNTRDTFGFRNITVIVIEMDAAVATQGSRRIRFWGTTAREVSDD